MDRPFLCRKSTALSENLRLYASECRRFRLEPGPVLKFVIWSDWHEQFKGIPHDFLIVDVTNGLKHAVASCQRNTIFVK